MNWKESKNKKLVEAVLSLKTPEEARSFLRDLMTEGEIQEFGRRFKAAEMLWEKETYSAVEKETRLSSATVARVSKWLDRGKGGYKTVINRLHHNSNPRPKRG